MSKARTLEFQNQVSDLSVEDRRFRLYLAVGVSFFFLVSSIMPFLDVKEKSREEQEKLPPQLTEFILKKKVEPKAIVALKPKVIEQKTEQKTEQKIVEKKPEPKPKPKPAAPTQLAKQKPAPANQEKQIKTPKVEQPIVAEQKRKITATEAERTTARAQASAAGVLAMQTGLAQLTSRHVKPSSAKTIGRVSESGKPQVNTALAAASQGRSGAHIVEQIQTDVIATVATQHATEVIAKRAVGAVLAESGAVQGTSNSEVQLSKSSALGVRDENSIRKIFEKNKSAIYSIYARAQRKNEDLAGKLVLDIDITPEGDVAGVQLIDTELNDEQLVKKIITRIRMFKFEAQNVAALTMRYTFDFVAS